jgi:hypothetical protein
LAVNSLKVLFNNRIEAEAPKIGEETSDEIVGQKYRAYIEAKKLLNKILNDLDSFDTVKRKKPAFSKEV